MTCAMGGVPHTGPQQFLMGCVFLFSLIRDELPGGITFYFYVASVTLQKEDMLHFLIVKDKTTML